MKECKTCGGTGKILDMSVGPVGHMGARKEPQKCPDCKGTGRVKTKFRVPPPEETETHVYPTPPSQESQKECLKCGYLTYDSPPCPKCGGGVMKPQESQDESLEDMFFNCWNEIDRRLDEGDLDEFHAGQVQREIAKKYAKLAQDHASTVADKAWLDGAESEHRYFVKHLNAMTIPMAEVECNCTTHKGINGLLIAELANLKGGKIKLYFDVYKGKTQ